MKYMVLYNSTVSAGEQMANSSPQERKAGMDAWMAWAAMAGDAVVDLGAPVEARRRLTAGSASTGTSPAAGYSVLQADSLDDLSDLLAKHPHLQMPDASIDVLEMLAMPGR